MKTKFFLLFVFFVFLMMIVAAGYCLLNALYWEFGFVVLLMCVIVLSFGGLLLYRRFIRKRLIDPKFHLKRKYSRLLLGEINPSVSVDENTLDLRGYRRNAYTDILLAQRYYSFLAKDGRIEIYACGSDYYTNSKKIPLLDYLLLHPVTLMENGISLNVRKYIIFNPVIGVVFLVSILINSLHCKGVSDKKNFVELKLFCEKRNLYMEIK